MMIRKIFAILLFVFSVAVYRAEADEPMVRIAILPWKVHAEPRYAYIGEALQDMLSTRIGSNRRVELTRKDVVRERLPEGVEITEGVAEKVGREVGAEYVLFGSLSVLGDHISMDARLVDVGKGEVVPIYRKSRGVGTVVDIADTVAQDVLKAVGTWKEPARADTPVYRGKFRPHEEDEPERKKPPEEEPQKSPAAVKGARADFLMAMDVDMDVKDIELHDLTGDGRKELLALTEDELIVFSIEIEGKRLKNLYTIDTGDGNISMDAVEGVLYISRLGRSSPDSCMVWYEEGLKKVCGIPYLVRVLYEDDMPVIVGQGFRREWGYTDRVVVLEREGHTLKKKEELRLPRGVTLYGLGFCRLEDDGAVSLLWLDGKGYLRVYRAAGDHTVGFSERWRSPTAYGGTLDWVELEEREDFVLFEGRFYCRDIDRDGRKELLVKKNTAGGIFGEWAERKRFFKSGSIRVLEWHGVSFSEEWKTDELTPYVADFVVDTVEGVKTLIVVTSEKGRFTGKEKSSILFYRLDL